MVPLAINTTSGTTERNTNMYNLTTMTGRINYGGANGNYFDDQINQYLSAGGNLDEIDDYTFSAWFDLDQEIESGTISEQDREEALAIAKAVFDERVERARRAAFVSDE